MTLTHSLSRQLTGRTCEIMLLALPVRTTGRSFLSSTSRSLSEVMRLSFVQITGWLEFGIREQISQLYQGSQDTLRRG